MKMIFLVLVIALTMIGCKGKDGSNGINGNSGGVMQIYDGVTPLDPWSVEINDFESTDLINVYYSLSTSTQTYFQMKGPETPSNTTPYYQFTFSGSNVLVLLNNLPIGSNYRLIVSRSNSVI